MAELERYSDDELSCIRNFTVRHKEFGSIRFIRPVDVRNLNLDKIIQFNRGEISLYPKSRMPPKDMGLNVEAEIQLEGCWPRKRCAERYEKYEKTLRQYSKKQKLRFVAYSRNTGRWTFVVTDFKPFCRV